MDPAKKGYLGAIKTKLDEITGYDAEKLAKGKNLGAINFEQGQSLFEQAIELAKELKALPIDLLPAGTLQQFVNPLESVRATLTQVSDFKLVGQSNPEGLRNTLLTQVGQNYDGLFSLVAPWLGYISLKSAEVQETMKRSKELLEKTRQQTNSFLEEIEKQKTEMDEIVRAAREAAGKIGVAQFAVNFENVAKKHAEGSKHWLIATILIAIATILAAVAALYFLPPLGDLGTPDTVQRIVTKLVIVSILYYSAIWASRIYRAHRHLQVVNEHRQNALHTFETFVKAAGPDEATKNAVLLEATHCIFSPAATGYLGGESEEVPTNRIVEILRSGGVGAAK